MVAQVVPRSGISDGRIYLTPGLITDNVQLCNNVSSCGFQSRRLARSGHTLNANIRESERVIASAAADRSAF